MPDQATLIGKTVYVFGGEDASRRPLRELHCLDLPTMAWSSPQTSGTPPAARSAHAAVVYKAGRTLPLEVLCAARWIRAAGDWQADCFCGGTYI